MILRTLFIFLLLMILYESAIRYLQPSLESRFTQWQNNITRAQKLVYDDELHEKTWIVGTSLTNRLDTETLSGFMNFSFGGLSVFESFRIMAEVKARPDTILVEINVIDRGESPQFEETVLHPVLYEMRNYLHGMRQAHQPIGLAVRYSSWLADRLLTQKSVKTPKYDSEAISNSVKTETSGQLPPEVNRLTAAIEVIKSEYSSEIAQPYLARQLQKLKAVVTAYEAAGTKIIFFEIPVNHSLVNLKKPTQIRNTFRTFFPEADYTYLPNDSRAYETTDGVHLNAIEGKLYATYLLNCLKRNR